MSSQGNSIPGLFSSDAQSQPSASSAPSLFSLTSTNSSENNEAYLKLRGPALIVEMTTEKENLDTRFIHSKRLLDEEIAKLQRLGNQPAADPNEKQVKKVYIPYDTQKQHNLVGRLLGPKGLTLKRMQAETQTRMSIMGRGCMRDKKKEEELRNSDDPINQHLKDDLHVLVQAEPPYAESKLAAGVAEVHKMLIPLEPGQPDVIAAKYLESGIDSMPPPAVKLPLDPPRTRGGAGGGRSGPRGGGGRGGFSPAGGRGGSSPAGGRMGGGRGRGGSRGGGRGAARGGRAPSRDGGGGGRRGVGGAGGGPRGGGGYPGREAPPPRMPPRDVGGFEDIKPSLDYESDRPFHSDRSWRDDDFDRRGGHSPRDYDRPSYVKSESYSSMDADPYYSSFSDAPQSRDYRHGLGSANDWKSPRAGKKDYRHHPYQTAGGYY